VGVRRDDLVVVCGAVISYALLILAAITDKSWLVDASTIAMIFTILISGMGCRP
jgi:hypothetical protein